MRKKQRRRMQQTLNVPVPHSKLRQQRLSGLAMKVVEKL